MTVGRARFSLLALFVVSLTLQLAGFFIVRHRMWPEDFQSLVLKVLAVYSVPLAVVLGGIFAQPKAGSEEATRALTWTALVLTATWNLLLVGRSAGFVRASHDSVGDLVSYLDAVALGSSFLVAGVITMFFGRGSVSMATAEPARRQQSPQEEAPDEPPRTDTEV